MPSYDPQTVLIVVDVQNDFADPEGSLYVTGGEEIIDTLNREIAAARAGAATVVLTQDWHPPGSPHFADHGGTWPVHCVRRTWGAELHPRLDTDADLVVRKGTGGEDGYSAFFVRDPETDRVRPTGLAGYLAARGISKAVVAGLAADVCVRDTAADARNEGLATTVLWEATRAVDLEPGDGDRARDALLAMGVTVTGAG